MARRHNALKGIMPLRCLDDAGHSLDASTLADADWAALTATNRRVRHLRTRCCGAPLVLKTSRLGTRFFAHRALGGCASGDEGPEHLHLKALAIAAARAAGWTAEAEVAGTTPAGEPWRADVLAHRGRHRVAVEIQWSPQADDETRRRQARYAASGVRGLWLCRHAVAAEPDVPAVRVGGTLAAGLTVLGVPAAAFLAAVFERRLRFGFPVGGSASVTVAGGIEPCWGGDCGALVRVATTVAVTACASVCRIPVAALGTAPALFAAVAAALPADPLRGRLRVNRERRAVCACFACGRPLVPRDRPTGHFTAARFDLILTPALAAEIAAQPGHVPAWSLFPVAPSAPGA